MRPVVVVKKMSEEGNRATKEFAAVSREKDTFTENGVLWYMAKQFMFTNPFTIFKTLSTKFIATGTVGYHTLAPKFIWGQGIPTLIAIVTVPPFVSVPFTKIVLQSPATFRMPGSLVVQVAAMTTVDPKRIYPVIEIGTDITPPFNIAVLISSVLKILYNTPVTLSALSITIYPIADVIFVLLNLSVSSMGTPTPGAQLATAIGTAFDDAREETSPKMPRVLPRSAPFAIRNVNVQITVVCVGVATP